MRRSLVLMGFLAVVAAGCFYVEAPAPRPSPSSEGTITIDNASNYVLTEVRVTTVRSSSWGPNLLGNDVLFPNERITVSVACARWDVLIADEYARSCVLADVDLCFSDQLWVIDDATLANCGF